MRTKLLLLISLVTCISCQQNEMLELDNGAMTRAITTKEPRTLFFTSDYGVDLSTSILYIEDLFTWEQDEIVVTAQPLCECYSVVKWVCNLPGSTQWQDPVSIQEGNDITVRGDEAFYFYPDSTIFKAIVRGPIEENIHLKPFKATIDVVGVEFDIADVVITLSSGGIPVPENMYVKVWVRGIAGMVVNTDFSQRYYNIQYDQPAQFFKLDAGQTRWVLYVDTGTNSCSTSSPGRPSVVPGFGEGMATVCFCDLIEVNYAVSLKDEYFIDDYYYVMGESTGIYR